MTSVLIVVPVKSPDDISHAEAAADHWLSIGHELALKGSIQLRVAIVVNGNLKAAMQSRRIKQAVDSPSKLISIHLLSDSTSKSDNVNFAIRGATEEVVAIFDCDARPNADAVEVAAKNAQQSDSPVQGSKSIRTNSVISYWGAIADLEYCFSSALTTQMVGRRAIFSGSNGYFPRSTLSALGDEPFLNVPSEDIDFSSRLYSRGVVIQFQPNSCSSESAPACFRSYLSQKRRWIYGWLRSIVRCLPMVLASSRTTMSSKAWWVSYLCWPVLLSATIACTGFVMIQAVGLLVALPAVYGMVLAFTTVLILRGKALIHPCEPLDGRRVVALFSFPLVMLAYVPILVSSILLPTRQFVVTQKV